MVHLQMVPSPRQSLCTTTDSLQCTQSLITKLSDIYDKIKNQTSVYGVFELLGARFDNINDPGYLLYPEDLDFFIEWELHDRLL